MGLFDTNGQTKAQNPDPAAQTAAPAIAQADSSCAAADAALSEALKALGQMCFEANENDPDSDYAAKVAEIKRCIEKAKLCRQYRLSLEGKALCESCGAVVTADSLFCNMCGAKMARRDFSSLNVCPSCGRPYPQGAAFCEMCGYKLA